MLKKLTKNLFEKSLKDRKELAADLKLVYGSIIEDEILTALSSFDEKWRK